MDKSNRNAAIAALIFVCVFGLAAYYLPTIMLAVGEVSAPAAIVIVAVFMVAPFAVLWLRGRWQRKR